MTAATIKAIEKSIRSGVSYADAARLSGIDPATFQRWMARGRQDIATGRASDFRDFCERVELANVVMKTTLTQYVMKGAKKDARIALKVLERRFPDVWGLKIRIEDTTPDKPASPREAFMKRLSVIEDRRQRAETALRGVMRDDATDLADGASGGNGVNGHGDSVDGGS